jgi:hypothetical protein
MRKSVLFLAMAAFVAATATSANAQVQRAGAYAQSTEPRTVRERCKKSLGGWWAEAGGGLPAGWRVARAMNDRVAECAAKGGPH